MKQKLSQAHRVALGAVLLLGAAYFGCDYQPACPQGYTYSTDRRVCIFTGDAGMPPPPRDSGPPPEIDSGSEEDAGEEIDAAADVDAGDESDAGGTDAGGADADAG